MQQLWGILYAALAASLNMKRAFGHCNPYHRSAFSRSWWENVSNNAELSVINYSHWASLPTVGKKVVVLHDLFSDYMWGSPQKEIEDLQAADLVVVISTDEEAKLNKRGIHRTIWSPPCVPETVMPKSTNVGLIGSKNRFNIEGLKWLSRNANKMPRTIRVYGVLGHMIEDARFQSVGVYEEWSQPYTECGIILLTAKSGMGLQIKGVEALACGRVIVARRGAMHGLPDDKEGAWIDVDTPEEMIEVVNRLRDDDIFYKRQSEKARFYYRKYLDCRCIHDQLMESYAALTLQSI